MMLALSRPRIWVTSARAPGTSGIPTVTRMRRPERTSPRWMMDERAIRSMFPPERMSPTRLSLNRSFCWARAASPAAPAPSTTVFSTSRRSRTAVSISSSSTRKMSSTCSRTMGRVRSPGRLTAIPSAMVWMPHWMVLPLTARAMEGNRAAWTPKTLMEGLSALAAMAFPEISPPPPMEIMRASRSGKSSSISRAMVPCPAMICSSS